MASEIIYDPTTNRIPWMDIRFDFPSDAVIYWGKATEHKAGTAGGGVWWVWKATFDVTGNVERVEGPLNGDWDNRAFLAWA